VVVVSTLAEFSFNLLDCGKILFVGGFRWVGRNVECDPRHRIASKGGVGIGHVLKMGPAPLL
jgi:hypothetical protein